MGVGPTALEAVFKLTMILYIIAEAVTDNMICDASSCEQWLGNVVVILHSPFVATVRIYENKQPLGSVSTCLNRYTCIFNGEDTNKTLSNNMIRENTNDYQSREQTKI